MNKQDYLNKLLNLTTEAQRDIFNRMYPDGPSKAQLNWATTQLENTLRGLNVMKEDLHKAKKEATAVEDGLTATIHMREKYIDHLNRELQEATNTISQLSNPISVDNAETQSRLELLEALEAGGVDNWEWYDESIEAYQENNNVIDT